MTDWWTYRPADLLMFSPRIYWRLFGAINADAWPLQPAIVAAGLAAVTLAWRRGTCGAAPAGAGAADSAGRAAERWALAFTAACWLAVAWTCLHLRLAPILPAADLFAWAFALQGVALGWSAWRAGRVSAALPRARRTDAPDARASDAASAPTGASRRGARRVAGLVLAAWALVAHPLLAWASGRPWDQAEVFGLAPDPTAIGTLGLLLTIRTPLHRALWVVPLAWCAASAAVLFTMGAPQGAVPLAAGIAAASAARRR